LKKEREVWNNSCVWRRELLHARLSTELFSAQERGDTWPIGVCVCVVCLLFDDGVAQKVRQKEARSSFA